jgi:hypothetical protein
VYTQRLSVTSVLGTVDPQTLEHVDEAIKISLGLIRL